MTTNLWCNDWGACLKYGRPCVRSGKTKAKTGWLRIRITCPFLLYHFRISKHYLYKSKLFLIDKLSWNAILCWQKEGSLKSEWLLFNANSAIPIKEVSQDKLHHTRHFSQKLTTYSTKLRSTFPKGLHDIYTTFFIFGQSLIDCINFLSEI
jgi:hypothetical protein